MSDDETTKNGTASEREAVEAEKAEREAIKAALAARKAHVAKVQAVRAERRVGKKQTKEAEKAERKTKSPEDLAAKAERKTAKRQAKEARKALPAEKAPEDLAAKAERKTAKRQAKEARKAPKASRVEKAPDVLAAKAERKAAKRQTNEAARAARKALKRPIEEAEKAPDETKPPKAVVDKAQRKAAKRQAKDAVKAERRKKTPEELAAKTERKAAKRQGKEAAKAARKAPAEAARNEHRAGKVSAKEAKAQSKSKPPEVLAAKAERKATKRQTKAARKAEKAERKSKTPEDPAGKAERKAAKREAKEAAKAARDAKAAQTAAARAARKAEKLQADKAGKAPDESKPPVDPAAKAQRKAAKRQTKEAAKTARKTKAPEDLAAKAERKAAKRQTKESAKAARDAKSAETAAARAARKADKALDESKPPVDPAAKAQRKVAKRQTKEAAKAGRRIKAPEDLAAKAERKTAKRQTKESAKAARDAKSAETAAARAARKAEKLKTGEAGQATGESKPPVDPAAKAERKAAKRQTKEAAKAARRIKAPEDLAAQAERKAAKRQTKESAKAARDAKTAQTAAARAARKAGKQQTGEAEKAQPESKPPVDPAAKAERKAAKRQTKEAAKAARRVKAPEELAVKAERKTAKQAAKESKKTESKSKTPEEIAAQAERKAAKQAAKEAKEARAQEQLATKAERRAAKRGAGPETSPEEKAQRKAAKDKAPQDPAKAEKKATKKQQAKSERKADKAEKDPAKAAVLAARAAKQASGEDDGLSPEESKAAREALKEQKRAAKTKAREDGEAVERVVRLSLAGSSAEEVTPLGSALQAAFTAVNAQTEAPKPDGKSDLLVHTFDDADAQTVARYAAVVAGRKARLHVFVETLEEGGEVNRAIARLAALNGGAVVSTRAKLKRFGLEENSFGGRPNENGLKLIAEAIVGIGAARLPKHSFAPQAGEAASGLVEARAAADQPMELLGKLRWSLMTPPRVLGAVIREDEVVAFADSKIVFSEEASLTLSTPVDWSVEMPDRRANYIFNGLDFLLSPLAYWYAKANNQGSERAAAVDAALKARGSNPNALFVRATQILVDFIARHPRSTAPKLWEEALVLRRAPVLAMFVLCCRVAYRRKLKFSESAFTAVYNALLDHAEIIRADDFYVPCSLDGIEQDRLSISIALALRGTPYGNLLLGEALERLKRLEVDPGLSAEGVWLGDSYGTHSSALALITSLFGDFPPNEMASLEPFTAATKKMTLFSEAMLKSNGLPPAFDGSKEKAYGQKISGMRKTIARASGKRVSAGKSALTMRITDTYVFREAQYFISHSQQKVVPESSLVVLHAAPPSVVSEDQGGVKLVFAYNDANLLIRAEPPEAQGEEEADETDPALRNFYRIDGKGNIAPESGSDKLARMVKSWRGPGWAAARAFENSYEGASVARTVIHLKAQHALVVVDELASGTEALFEQFWNLGPDFTAPETTALPLHFASDGQGVLNVALTAADEVTAVRGEGGTTLRGAVRLNQGVVASLFQWTDEPAPVALGVERGDAGEWTVTASGKGFSARLSHAGNDLGCELSEG
jgi:histone H1/5